MIVERVKALPWADGNAFGFVSAWDSSDKLEDNSRPEFQANCAASSSVSRT